MNSKFVSPTPMPTAHEHELLTILMEECAEVIVRASRIKRFGVFEVRPGQPKHNAERLSNELGDIMQVMYRLRAHGIVAPYVETEEQVKELVGAVHYRPVKGRKLDELLAGKEPVTAKMKEFFADFNRHNFLIIGIESIPAVENLDALINIKGVDGVFIGPHDMTTSMGCPNEYQNPEYIAVLKEIIIKCRKAGIGVGGHFQPGNTPVERMHEFMDLGMNWILDASDINYAVAGLSARRRSLGFDDVSPANAALKICDGPKTCAG